MKTISYNPNEIKDIPAFFNKYLDEFKNEDYIMFIFNDINENIIDKNKFIDSYIHLMKNFDLPYTFYPYYIHFNRIFPESIGIPNPRAHVQSDKGIFDIVNNPAYGVLIIDVQKINSINFRFNLKYKLSFYIQDLIHQCFVNNLWMSETYYLDVVNSFNMVKKITTGYTIHPINFNQEKQQFFNENKVIPESINDFIIKLKNKFHHESQINTEIPEMIDLSKANYEETK